MWVTSTAQKQNLWSILQGRVVPAVVLMYLVVGLVVMAITPPLAFRWMEQPFIGAFIEQTLIINNVSPSRWGAWAVHHAIHEFGYRIVAIDGQELHSTADLEQELSRRAPGDLVLLTFQSPNGVLITRQSVLQRFPLSDRIAFFFLPYFIALVYMISSLWVYILRRWDVTGQVFSFFATSVAISLASLFDIYTTHRLTSLWTVAVALSGGSIINLALVFPNELIRSPVLRWVGFFPGLALAAYSIKDLYNFTNPSAYTLGWRLEYVFCGVAFLLFVFSTIYRLLRSASPPGCRTGAPDHVGSCSLLWFPCHLVFHYSYIPRDQVYSPALAAYRNLSPGKCVCDLTLSLAAG